MNQLENIANLLEIRQRRIMANPADYGASEYKYRVDELRLAVGLIRRVQRAEKQPVLRKAA